MLVKIARLGQQVKEIMVEDNTTIEKALEIVEIVRKADEQIKVSGSTITNGYILRDGDIITLIPNIEGGKN